MNMVSYVYFYLKWVNWYFICIWCKNTPHVQTTKSSKSWGEKKDKKQKIKNKKFKPASWQKHFPNFNATKVVLHILKALWNIEGFRNGPWSESYSIQLLQTTLPNIVRIEIILLLLYRGSKCSKFALRHNPSFFFFYQWKEATQINIHLPH